MLADGTVTESATDAFLPGVTVSWFHERHYSSALKQGAHIQGVGWKCTWLTTFLSPVEGSENIELYLDHLCKRVFTSNDGETFTPPPDYLATLVVPDEIDGKGYYRLTLTQSGETFFFCDFSEDWEDNEKGLLRYRTDRYGASDLEYRTNWLTYSYDDETSTGRITSVTTSQGWSVVYSYVDGGPNGGRLRQIDVKNGDTPTPRTLQRVKYKYYESDSGYSTDCGDDGDLIMVEVFKRATSDDLTQSDDEDFSIQQITMYRYFREGDGNGGAHQLKMVLAPASVKKAMDDGSKTAAQLLGLDDDGVVTGSVTLQDYANVTYKYYPEPFDTAALGGTYGGSNFDETGFAKSQTVRKDYKGYLGTRTYYYMNNSVVDDLNAVQRIVVEDHTEAGTRTVYGLNKDRLTLRQVFVDNPDSSPKYWCQSFVMGETAGQNANQVVEKRLPSAHTCIDTTGEVTTFLDVQDTWTSASIMNQSSGVVYVYDYNADGYLIKERVKQGNSNVSTAIYLRVVEYGDGAANRPKYLPWKTYVYHTATTTEATESARFLITTTYTFHDSGTDLQMQEKTVTREAVPSEQNGPGVSVVTKEYYDDRGRLRWTQDGEGYVNYYSYHEDTGGLAYTMIDVETDDLPTDITDGNEPKWIDWSGNAPFTHTDNNSLQLVAKREFDDLGREVKAEDPKGTLVCTAYKDNETRVYPGWSTATHTAALPIRVEKTNKDDLTLQMYSLDPAGVTEGYNATTHLPTGSDTGEGQDDYVTWTRYAYNSTTSLLESVDRYHDIPTSGTGTLTTNYYRTFHRHDTQGRRTRTISVVSGTATSSSVEQVVKTNYDALGRVESVERGVSGTGQDMGSTYATDPTNPALKKTSAAFFDEATPGSGTSGVGDGLVTCTRQYYNADNAGQYVQTIYRYNWRGQLRGLQPETNPYTVQDVDNLGRTVAVAQFSNTTNFGSGWSNVLGDDDYAQNATDDKRASLATTAYDEMGRVYQTRVHNVAYGPGDYVKADQYYDLNSRLVASTSPGQGAAEYAYDGAGRQTESRSLKELETTKYASGEFQYRDPQPGATSGGDDGVIQLTRTTYDSTGNPTKSLTLAANHVKTDGTTINNDGISLDNADYVQTWAYSWYDDYGRLTGSASYGTNTTAWTYEDTAPDYGSTPPARSDSVLVATTAYDAAGRPWTVTDPKGYVTRSTYDDLGRTVKTEEDQGGANERTTLAGYDGLSNVVQQIADIDKDDTTLSGGVWTTDSDDQVTTYTFYDSTRSPYHAGLLTQTKYPDGDDTDDNTQTAYALDGRPTERLLQKLAGQNDRPALAFDYDDTLRRLTAQRLTEAGGVDTAVQSIAYAYYIGRMYLLTSYPTNDCSGTPLNQVYRTYNDAFGILWGESQEHEGATDADSIRVVYSFATTVSGGVYTYGRRLTSVYYPSVGANCLVRPASAVAARRVYALYNDAGDSSGLGDAVSRPTALASAWTRGANDANVYAAYAYNGAGRIVVEDYTQPDVRLDHWGQTAGTYAGLDALGRTKQQLWRYYGGTPADLDRFEYTYDRNSNRTSKDLTLTTGKDEKYAYDNLNRLTSYDRGTLSGGDITNKVRNEAWGLSPTGAWNDYQIDANGDGDYSDTGTEEVDQDRTHNLVNEIWNATPGNAITEQADPQQTQWADPAYSARGNMTTVPKPTALTSTYACKYDAWNRLTEVKSGEIVVAKLLETRLSTSENTEPQTLQPEYQYVWSVRYLDAPVLRDKNTDDDDLCDDQRLYFTNDANMNVTALIGTDGTPLERYVYDPYGKVTIYDDDWSETRETSSYDNNILFAGYYLDWETGLYHVRNRYYHTQFGWLTRDPAGYVDGMSLYEYVGCAPCVRYDPFGMIGYGDLRDAAKTAAGVVGQCALGVVEAATGIPMSEVAPPTTPLERDARNLGHGTAAAGGAALTAKGIADTAFGSAMMGTGLATMAAGAKGGAVVGTGVEPGGGTGVGALVGGAPGAVMTAAGAKLTVIGVVETVVGGWILKNAMSCPSARVGGSSDEGEGNTEKPCQEGKSSKTIRKEWEEENSQQWPKDPETGQNQDVSHKTAKADGGTDELSNIEPKPHDEHMQDHMDKGDFKRWGARSQGGGQ
ncbi:MAG: hypothetical protein NTX40_00200 [Planctomycetota bacterium]|nr:hypothetical protein [Planctomycetota bacterium]